VPELPEEPELEEPELPAAPEEPAGSDAQLVAGHAAAPLVVEPLELLPLLVSPEDPPPRMELHADMPNASANRPAKTALCFFCIMINSFGWIFLVGVRDDACHCGKRFEWS